MGDASGAIPDQKPQEWVIYAVAVLAEAVPAAGIIPPQYLSILRSLVMYCLYREWGLAVACGLILPRFVPLVGVCFLKQKWLALKVRYNRTLPLYGQHLFTSPAIIRLSLFLHLLFSSSLLHEPCLCVPGVFGMFSNHCGRISDSPRVPWPSSNIFT